MTTKVPTARSPQSCEATARRRPDRAAALKTLYGGEPRADARRAACCLPYAILEPLVERIRAERLIEVRGAAGSERSGYRYALTDLGRDRARQYLDANQYTGAAPVPLASYVAYMRALAQRAATSIASGCETASPT